MRVCHQDQRAPSARRTASRVGPGRGLPAEATSPQGGLERGREDEAASESWRRAAHPGSTLSGCGGLRSSLDLRVFLCKTGRRSADLGPALSGSSGNGSVTGVDAGGLSWVGGGGRHTPGGTMRWVVRPGEVCYRASLCLGGGRAV